MSSNRFCFCFDTCGLKKVKSFPFLAHGILGFARLLRASVSIDRRRGSDRWRMTRRLKLQSPGANKHTRLNGALRDACNVSVGAPTATPRCSVPLPVSNMASAEWCEIRNVRLVCCFLGFVCGCWPHEVFS